MASELNDGYSVVQADNSRDGSIDVKERYIRFEKVPYFLAFRAFDRQRQRADLTIIIVLSEHINRFVRRVE